MAVVTVINNGSVVDGLIEEVLFLSSFLFFLLWDME